MNTLFGIPMTTVMIALLAALALVLLATVYVAVRNPVIFRLGIRNVPRRRAQTALIVVGLMLSTLVISAALTTGDTVSYSMGDTVYRSLGRVDEVIRPEQDPHRGRQGADRVPAQRNETGADKLEARVGDTLQSVYGNRPVTLRVAGIARDGAFGGNTGGNALPSLLIPLDRAQALFGRQDDYGAIFVASAGTV